MCAFFFDSQITLFRSPYESFFPILQYINIHIKKGGISFKKIIIEGFAFIGGLLISLTIILSAAI